MFAIRRHVLEVGVGAGGSDGRPADLTLSCGGVDLFVDLAVIALGFTAVVEFDDYILILMHWRTADQFLCRVGPRFAKHFPHPSVVFLECRHWLSAYMTRLTCADHRLLVALHIEVIFGIVRTAGLRAGLVCQQTHDQERDLQNYLQDLLIRVLVFDCLRGSLRPVVGRPNDFAILYDGIRFAVGVIATSVAVVVCLAFLVVLVPGPAIKTSTIVHVLAVVGSDVEVKVCRTHADSSVLVIGGTGQAVTALEITGAEVAESVALYTSTSGPIEPKAVKTLTLPDIVRAVH